jgi:uncharacterized membrane protein
MRLPAFTRRFVAGIVIFYLACLGVLLYWGTLGNVRAITLFGVVLGLIGIAVGECYLVYMLLHPPFGNGWERIKAWRSR